MIRLFCCLALCFFTTVEGAQHYGRVELESLEASGVVILDGTVVKGYVQVFGNLEATNADLGGIQVNGQVHLYGCTVRGYTIVNGALTGMSTLFQQKISAASQKIVLISSYAPALTVRPIAGYRGVQWIVLSQWTKIPGPVIVESGRGEIWMSNYSNITNYYSGARVYNQVLD